MSYADATDADADATLLAVAAAAFALYTSINFKSL